MPQSGWELFQYAYKRLDYHRPSNNLWACDLGKLIVPNIFVEVDLIKAVVECDDPDLRIIRRKKGTPLMDITKSHIVRTFRLNPSATVSIHFNALCQEYERDKYGYMNYILSRHRRKDLGKKGVNFTPKEFEPFNCDEFEDYFKNTYFGLSQVLGRTYDLRMLVALMMMEMDIQDKYSNKGFDYASYLEEQIHNQLKDLKEPNAPLKFTHYFVLMHMFCGVVRRHGPSLWT